MATVTELENVAALAIIAATLRKRKRRKRRATLQYVLDRNVHGAFHSLVQELAEQDSKSLKRFLQMSSKSFDELLHLVGPLIQRKDTLFKDSIAPEERLAVTLSFLATGGTYAQQFSDFHIPVTTLHYIIPQTCQAIYAALKEVSLKTPETEAQWKEIQTEFMNRWQFPQCIGALDGKHIAIRCPPNSGSNYFNYQKFFSVVLFALVDAEYKFLYNEVGANGKFGDSTIWDVSPLKQKLESEDNELHLPQPLTTNAGQPLPSVVVGDSDFAPSSRLMRPHPDRGVTRDQRIFNYRLSRATSVAENAFGLLAARFGMYQTPLRVSPDRAETIILATLALHNFLRLSKDQQYCGPKAVDHEQGVDRQLVLGEWRANKKANLIGLQPLPAGAHKHRHASGAEVRNAFTEYFVGEGAVPWQEHLVL